MNSSMQPYRFEVRIRPGIALEDRLIAELQGLDGIYGAKSQLLRECLLRGIFVLESALADLPQETSQQEALQTLSDKLKGAHYSYRTGVIFLQARAACLISGDSKNEGCLNQPGHKQQSKETLIPERQQQKTKSSSSNRWASLKDKASSGF